VRIKPKTLQYVKYLTISLLFIDVDILCLNKISQYTYFFYKNSFISKNTRLIFVQNLRTN